MVLAILLGNAAYDMVWMLINPDEDSDDDFDDYAT
jgi:hypothetical protein